MIAPQLPLKIAPSRWPRGSEWRRWDLHVHTPESRLGSPFGGLTWEHYVTAVETTATEAKISVIGVTDYMTLDGYEKLFEEKNANGRLSTVDLLIPNIEFRMMPQTADGKALNLHLLVDPSEDDHVDKIKRALRKPTVVFCEFRIREMGFTYSFDGMLQFPFFEGGVKDRHAEIQESQLSADRIFQGFRHGRSRIPVHPVRSSQR